MRDEKKVLYEKIAEYERELADKEDSSRRISDMEG